jgi:hypothetical protein
MQSTVTTQPQLHPALLGFCQHFLLPSVALARGDDETVATGAGVGVEARELLDGEGNELGETLAFGVAIGKGVELGAGLIEGRGPQLPCSSELQ